MALLISMNNPHKFFFMAEKKVGIFFSQAIVVNQEMFSDFFNAKLRAPLSIKHSTSMFKQT